jgi:hypothetical protein
MATGWTSLEIVKLVVDVLTPIAVVGLGIFVARTTSRLEQNQWAGQKVVESRLEVFKEVAPKLNRLLCFHTFVGTWKDIRPADMVRMKRELDETMHVYRILFSPELFASYYGFINLLFKTYRAADSDAAIRADIESQLGNRRSLPWWTEDLVARFSSNDIPTPGAVAAAYHELGESFRRDLYVTDPQSNDQ